DYVRARTADQSVITVAAVFGQGDRIYLKTAGVDDIVARKGVDCELVARAITSRDVHRSRQARYRDAGRRTGDFDVVGAGGAVDDDGVGLAVADAAAWCAFEVKVYCGDVGAGQVANGDVVSAPLGVEVDALNAIEVHRHGGHVAEETDTCAIGGDVDTFV